MMHSQGTDTIAFGLSGEELLASIFDDFFYGVTIVNAASEIVYYNGTQSLIDGVPPSEALGKTLDEIHRPDGRPAPTLAASLSRTPAVNQPFLYRTAAGRLVNSVQNAFPITKDGVLLGCVTFIGEYGRIMDAYAAAAVAGGGHAPSGDGREAAAPPSADGGEVTAPPAVPAGASGHGPNAMTIVTADKVMEAVVEAAYRAVDTPSPVLLCGEPGTGKDHLARAAAARSARKRGPFLSLKIGGVPESLLEGILFGTEEGAYTGAVSRPGILELAAGGTVYLDGIVFAPPWIQDRLLSAAEEGRAPRMGAASAERELDVKFMSASSEPLREAVTSGKVRPGLLSALGVVTLNLPPLRDRRGDVPLLTDHFVKSCGAAIGKGADGVSGDVREAFSRHQWPGNVRELKSGIEGALSVLAPGEALLASRHFSSTLLGGLFGKSGPGSASSGAAQDSLRPAHYLHSAAEAERIAAALEAAGGNAAKAARSLKISPQLMNYKLKKFALKKKITVQVG